MNDFNKDINVPSKDIVYRQDVEDMLQNALPSRGMWEIEGDVVKNTICETVVDLMMDLGKLPSAQAEIIRCKDCLFGYRYFDVQNGVTDSWVECRNPDGLNRDVSDDGYCSASVRRQ